VGSIPDKRTFAEVGLKARKLVLLWLMRTQATRQIFCAVKSPNERPVDFNNLPA
jgi:hypothetical protein